MLLTTYYFVDSIDKHEIYYFFKTISATKNSDLLRNWLQNDKFAK